MIPVANPKAYHSLLASGMPEEQAANPMGITIQELREYENKAIFKPCMENILN